jgi:hypothetical protein
MLAQNFMKSADLDLTDEQFEALCKTLVLLETEKLRHVPVVKDFVDGNYAFSGRFNMCNWAGHHPCGTVACIGGTAELIGNVSFGYHLALKRTNLRLYRLFFPPMKSSMWSSITPQQAATALRSYLTTGNPHWDLAVAWPL